MSSFDANFIKQMLPYLTPNHNRSQLVRIHKLWVNPDDVTTVVNIKEPGANRFTVRVVMRNDQPITFNIHGTEEAAIIVMNQIAECLNNRTAYDPIEATP